MRGHTPVSYLYRVNKLAVFHEHIVDDIAHDHAGHRRKVPKLAHVQKHIVGVYILSAYVYDRLPV